MESKVNYTIVGVFVALLLAGLLVFFYWLGKYNSNQQYDYYHVYMTESVAGLSTDASVKFMGVDVGSVTKIDINPKNSEQVELLLQIRQGIPVKEDTTATLRFYGITGLAFIELLGGGEHSPLLVPSHAGEIPVITESASTFSNIQKTLNDLAGNSATVLKKIDRLLSDDNLNHVNTILLETKSLLEDFRQQQPRITSLINTGIVAEKSIKTALDKVTIAAESVVVMTDSLAKNGSVMESQWIKTLKDIGIASNSVEQMADSFKQNYADSGQDISNDVTHSLASFRQMLYQMDMLVVELQQTTRTIKDSPSDLLFKRSQTKLGPGEELKNEN